MRLRQLLQGHRPATSDVGLAVVVVLVGLAEVWFIGEVDRSPASLGAVVMGSALAWRRELPVVACLTVAWTELLVAQLGVPIDSWVFVLLVFVLAIYSLGAYATTRRSVAGIAGTLLAVTLSVFANDGPGVENLGFSIVVVGAPWLAGRLVRHRTNQAVELAMHAQELERRHKEREQAAVAEERARIARELHDIIAHSVSVMTIQAGAIEEVVGDDVDKALAAAGSIRRTGRQTLTDLRQLLGLIREEPADTELLTPQPGLDDLHRLIEQVETAGLTVRLTVEGTPQPLPPAVDLSAFRVVQEALTNTLKHARATASMVSIRYTADSLDIEVSDDGVAELTSDQGHGLIGMRERLGLYDGTLEFGRPPAGGFRVHALFPMGEAR